MGGVGNAVPVLDILQNDKTALQTRFISSKCNHCLLFPVVIPGRSPEISFSCCNARYPVYKSLKDRNGLLAWYLIKLDRKSGSLLTMDSCSGFSVSSRLELKLGRTRLYTDDSILPPVISFSSSRNNPAM